MSKVQSPKSNIHRVSVFRKAHFNAAHRLHNPKWSDEGLRLAIYKNSAPINLAFEFFIRNKGREYPAGSITYPKASTSASIYTLQDYPKPLPEKVDIIFRSSEAVARHTMDFTQIWKGELVFKDVPIVKPATRPTTTRNSVDSTPQSR